MLEIRFDNEKLKKYQRELKGIPRALPKVMSRGLNRTATSARTAMSRSLASRTGLKIKDVRGRLALQKASYSNWRSAVRISGKRLSLSYQQPRQTSRGLSVKHQRKRVTIRTAFPALRGWFIRLPKAGSYKQTIGVKDALGIDPAKKTGRLPIARIKGPILSQVYTGARGEVKRIQAEFSVKLAKNIHDQVNLILKRRLPA